MSEEDLKTLERLILKLSQIESYKSEYDDLNQGKDINKNSCLSFKPILQDELLHVGDRIDKAALPCEMKHQIIIHKDHPIAVLIVQRYHKLVNHSGREQTLAEIRRKFWIIKGRGLVKRIISK